MEVVIRTYCTHFFLTLEEDEADLWKPLELD